MRNNEELVRVRSILENDRMNTGDNFLELITSDLFDLLGEYFDFQGLPKLNIEKFGDRYKVDISVLASRIKSFECVPK